MDLPTFITVEQAEKATGLPQSLIRKWMRRDEPPPAVPNGRQVFIEVEGLRDFIKEEEKRWKLQNK